MATPLENLLTRQAAICEELAALDASAAGGKPNAPNNADHVGYKDGLYRELREIRSEIAALQGVAEVESYGFV